jgi:DtxR family transcriptional regulator, Mn-dependent transcriptional regulator
MAKPDPHDRSLDLTTMARPALTEAIQDYLREIYKLGTEEPRVSVTSLAKRQGVSPASASAMVKKLAALGLADHQPYRGITLTDAGERVALEVIRHHRLLELYLAETLGLHVDDVHDEAERLEHVISEELEARIDRALGYPTHDPHGDPIPDADLRWPAVKRPVRASGPGDGVRGNREVPPTTHAAPDRSRRAKAKS